MVKWSLDILLIFETKTLIITLNIKFQDLFTKKNVIVTNTAYNLFP